MTFREVDVTPLVRTLNVYDHIYLETHFKVLSTVFKAFTHHSGPCQPLVSGLPLLCQTNAPSTLVSQNAPRSLQSPLQAPSVWNILLPFLPSSSYTLISFPSLPTQVLWTGHCITFPPRTLLSRWCQDPTACQSLSKHMVA